jgi:hypothetical protein
MNVLIKPLPLLETGPRFTYYCNNLMGDEDIVIYETVRPYEQGALSDLASTLKSTGFGVILIFWRSKGSWGSKKSLWGFFEAADSFDLPLINLNEDEDHVIECLPPSDANLSIPAEKVIYRDEVHPTRLGEIMLAAMVGHTIEEALKQPPEHSLQSNSNSQNDVPLVKKFSVDAPICFDRLNCTEGLSENNGMQHSCLKTNSSEGFVLKSLPSGKVWWEGTAPGHTLDVFIDRPCSEIAIFHYKRPSNGMVQILVDGKVLDSTFSPLANGILDGWREEWSWLPNEKGHLTNSVIAHRLEPKPHTLRLIVQNRTHLKNGTFKFDFTGIACKAAT